MCKGHTSFERGSLLKQCKESAQHSSWQRAVVNNVNDNDSGSNGSGDDNDDGEAGGHGDSDSGGDDMVVVVIVLMTTTAAMEEHPLFKYCHHIFLTNCRAD